MVQNDEIMMMLISQQNQITKLNDEMKELRKKFQIIRKVNQQD